MKKILNPTREEYIRKWKARGNKTTFYTCRHCNKRIETPQPTEDMTGSKGYWDSATSCPECKEINFVCVYPSGHTRSKKLGS